MNLLSKKFGIYKIILEVELLANGKKCMSIDSTFNRFYGDDEKFDCKPPSRWKILGKVIVISANKI